MEIDANRQSNVATDLYNFDETDYNANKLIHYDKLVRQSPMNNFFNVNDFIDSTTIPEHSVDNIAQTTTNILLIFKCFIISFIILAAIFGNMLVIVSVMQHRKLRLVKFLK